MTQLDVPNISFTHYLDLLRRRTWHVIIVSVLGLITGGVVAMLIPRYYVAHTQVELSRPILDPQVGTPADPMSPLIDSAIRTVPTQIRAAIRELGWTEGITGTDDERRTFLFEAKERVEVIDMGPPGMKERRKAYLSIGFRDLDGKRAADMANKLRDLWLSEVYDGLREQAEEEIQVVVRRKQTKQREKRIAAREVQKFEEQHGINPANWRGNRAGEIAALTREQLALQSRIGNLRSQIKGNARKIRERKGRLDALPPMLPVDLADQLEDPARSKAYAQALAAMLRAQALLKTVTPAHEDFESAKRTLESARTTIAELQKFAGGSTSERPNPDYVELENELRDLTNQQGLDQDEVIDLEARSAKLAEKLEKLPSIYFDYREKVDRVTALSVAEKQLAAELDEKNKMMARIKTERPYRVVYPAYVPPAPTEPDPLMLALTGCIVGLALAIGLVLVIDLLQMSFKTVADVESGLGLPVLGTMTYLETEEEIDSTRERRTKVTIFAVVFLVLLLTIVTIYYVSPTSLPSIVTDILDQILSEPK